MLGESVLMCVCCWGGCGARLEGRTEDQISPEQEGCCPGHGRGQSGRGPGDASGGSRQTGCLCMCGNWSYSFLFQKSRISRIVSHNQFLESFISKHCQSNLPFSSAFRVRVKLICVFNLRGKMCSSGLEIPGLGVLSPGPSSPIPLRLPPHLRQAESQGWGAKVIILICFFFFFYD